MLRATILACAGLPAVGSGGEVGEVLTAMTLNLRYANDHPGEAWSERRPMVQRAIQSVAPDVIGMQEALHSQIRDLASDLADFDWVGLGREGGSRDEFCAVFYRTARFEVRAFDHFWLSDTPERIGSITWGNRFARMVTWVRLHDRHTAREFYVWNTHFDHESPAARLKSAELICARVRGLTPELPLILLGDFNAAADRDRVHAVFLQDGTFVDSWNAAPTRRGGRRGTFNGFGTFPLGDARIDWILLRGAISAEFAEVVEYAEQGRFPSDHFPVIARLKLR